MNALNMFVKVPSWAYDFCYYYLAAAAVAVVYSLYSVVKLFMVPSELRKAVPVTTVTLSLLLSGAVAALLALMEFWICRSALSPSAMKEKFAVMCKNTGDCLAVAGTQSSGSLCTCGQRGFCAGCTMNNNMEPSMMSEYGQPLAGLAQ